FIGLDVTGELALATDGAIHPLGRFDQAAFEADAKAVLVWNSAEWTLFSRAGARVAGEPLVSSRPLLLPSGALLLDIGAKATRLVSRTSETRFEVPLHCDEVFPRAGRLVCTDRTDPRGPLTVVL